MKKLPYLILAVAIFLIAACSSNHQHENGAGGSEAKAHGTTKEYTSAYVCPMHCEGSGSDQAGKCPVCGMDYVPLSEHVHDGHNH